jgi:glycosyltransferase involved in cell wall biosynthesis
MAHEAVPRHLRGVDIAVAPYPPLDPFYFSPLKVLEYMATGRAIVASRVGQISELIEDGVTGLLVSPGDPAALAAALDRLAGHTGLRTALGRKAATAARECHLWTSRVDAIEALAAQFVEERVTCGSTIGA